MCSEYLWAKLLASKKHKLSVYNNYIYILVFKHFLLQDITRIAHSLSKTVKSNIPCIEFGPGQHVDINAVLSVVEDFIKQNIKTSDTSQVKTQSSHDLGQPQLPGVYLLWRVNSVTFYISLSLLCTVLVQYGVRWI